MTAPDGTVLTSDNVVKYLGNDIYIKYADDSEARKQYQSQIATDLIDRVLHLKGGTSALVKALSQSVSGGHVQMWSADQATQDVLATTPLAGQTSPHRDPTHSWCSTTAAATSWITTCSGRWSTRPGNASTMGPGNRR